MANKKSKTDNNPIQSKQEPAENSLGSLESSVINDPATDEAVMEIVDGESEKLLNGPDNLENQRTSDKQPKQKSRFETWLATKKAKKVILTALVFIIVCLAVLPWSRYFLLNSAGVRVSSSITIVDDSTGQPLKNVSVSLGSLNAKTDASGRVKIDNLRLGPANLKVEKVAFAPINKKITLGWGSNPLGNLKLIPTGAQYQISITDFLSGKGVKGIEASFDDASALSDEEGKIKLTIGQTELETLKINIYAKDYRQETLEINVNELGPHSIKLVPARKHAFISKRSGKYDIYNIYVDGKDEKLVLKGTGSEKEDLALLMHPSANVAAYVSTRGNQHNSDGYLLSNLILINFDDDKTSFIGTSEKIQIIGWSGDWLIYVQISAGGSAAFDRSKLMSYNYQDGTTKQLAASNYFNDLLLAGGKVYFAPSSTADGGLAAKFYKIEPDGGGSQTLFNDEVWGFTRTAYDHIALSVGQSWYDYKLGQTAITRLNSAPADAKSRRYLDRYDSKYSIWVEQRDGKNALILYDLSKNEDKIITSQKGLGLPLTWLSSNTVIYRVDGEHGVADYAVSLDGGEPVKIKDVTKTNDNDNWYYF